VCSEGQELTRFVQGNLLRTTQGLMFMKVSKRMTKLVQNDTTILLSYLRIGIYPAEVHGSLTRGNPFDVARNVRPRTLILLECNANGRVPSRKELELDVDVGFPFLDDLLHFVLLVLRPNGLDEAVGDGLLEGQNNSIKGSRRSRYLFVVPHAIGIGEDSAKVPKAGLLSTAGPFIEGSAPAEMPVFFGVLFDIIMYGGLFRHGIDKDEGKRGNLGVSLVGIWKKRPLRGPFILSCRIWTKSGTFEAPQTIDNDMHLRRWGYHVLR